MRRPGQLRNIPTPTGWLDREPPDLGPGTIGSSIAGGVAPRPDGVRVVLPAVNYFPAGGYPIDEISDADIAPGASANVLTFNVPEKVQFRIVGIGFGADDEVALRFLTWNLLVGGNAFRAYGNQSAAIGTIVETSPINFHVRDAVTVIVRLTSDAAAVLTYRFVVRVAGWLFQDEGSL